MAWGDPIVHGDAAVLGSPYGRLGRVPSVVCTADDMVNRYINCPEAFADEYRLVEQAPNAESGSRLSSEYSGRSYRRLPPHQLGPSRSFDTSHVQERWTGETQNEYFPTMDPLPRRSHHAQLSSRMHQR